MKKFINKILDVPKLIRTIWIMLWVILIILLVFKFCFNLWYPVVVENESFISVCNFIDNHEWLSKTIMLLFYIFASNIIFLTSIRGKKYPKWYFWILAILVPMGMFGLKYISNVLGIIIEVLILIVLPIILNIKLNRFKNKYLNIFVPIIVYILINVWQFTMLIVRGTDSLVLSDLPSLIYLILQLDYYIFLSITFMEVCYMGLLSPGWFWSKDVTILKAEREKELAKSEPDMKLVEKIDSRIAELEKEGK